LNGARSILLVWFISQQEFKLALIKSHTSFPSSTDKQWTIPETSAKRTALSSCITAGDENTGLLSLHFQRRWPSFSAREEHVPSNAAANTALATQGEE
jgi:hypothetical protein